VHAPEVQFYLIPTLSRSTGSTRWAMGKALYQSMGLVATERRMITEDPEEIAMVVVVPDCQSNERHCPIALEEKPPGSELMAELYNKSAHCGYLGIDKAERGDELFSAPIH
jgi:hypothetical protein